MIKLLFLLFIFSTNVFASSKLQNGDVILIALNCYSCTMIEKEEGGPYSHSGVIVNIGEKHFVAQALGPVHILPLQNFIHQSRPQTQVAIYRPKEFIQTEPSLRDLMSVFNQNFKDKPFDPLYLWDNFDDEGNEKLYCSEFVAKYLNYFLTDKLKPRPMDYTDNWDYWYQVYDGDVPQGEPGNSPVSLSRNPKLKFIKYLSK